MPEIFQPGDVVECIDAEHQTTNSHSFRVRLGAQYTVAHISGLHYNPEFHRVIFVDEVLGGRRWFLNRFRLVSRNPNFQAPPAPRNPKLKTNHRIGVPKGKLP